MPGPTVAAGILDVVLPGICAACAEPLRGAARGLCAACWATVLPDPGGRCPRCGAPVEPSEPHCLACTEAPPTQAGTVVWGAYEGTLRRAILALKHHGHDEVARPLGRRLAARASEEAWAGGLDCVVPVPTHPWHRLRRGYAAAELLAHEVAGVLGLPHRRVLRRHGLGRQATRTRARRRSLPRSAFSARRRVEAGSVLLVDDVMATGATVRRAAEALHGAGYENVYVAVMAAAS